MKVERIVITFPVEMDVSDSGQRVIANIIERIIAQNPNPAMHMWLGMVGHPMSNPFMEDEEHPLKCDESTLLFEVTARKKEAQNERS